MLNEIHSRFSEQIRDRFEKSILIAESERRAGINQSTLCIPLSFYFFIFPYLYFLLFYFSFTTLLTRIQTDAIRFS